MTTGKTILTFLGGAAAGVLAGILLAPKSGKETREVIAKRAIDIKDEIGTTLETNGDKIKSLTNSAFAEVNRKVSELI